MRVSSKTTDTLKQILDQYKSKYHVEVELLELDWVTARDDLNRVAYMQQGPDISQVGSTWLSDYAAMNALLPISPKELPDVTSRKNYHASAWQSVHLHGDKTIWAIPWLEEPYIIYYQAGILEAAGIDAKDAFATVGAFDETAARLSDFGISVPVLIPIVVNRFVFLHTLASWVWSAGGQFTSEDGSKMRFNEPEALAGMRKYFSLLRHVAPESRDLLLKKETSKELLHSKNMAITFGTLRWPLKDIAPQDADKWHSAILPGTRFMGGSSLAAWKHTRNKKAVLNLIHFLMQPDIALKYANASWSLPTHKEAQSLAKKEDPTRRIMIEALSSGRSYKPVRLWGMIETRLLDALMGVGISYLENPQVDIDNLLEEYVVSLAKRLNMTLSVTM